MKFQQITGQSHLKAMLSQAADSGRVSHALLFTGNPGYGALPLALAYAGYLNCTARSGGDSCGECPSCVKMSQLIHPDVHFVFPSVAGKQSSGSRTSDNHLPMWREIITQTEGYFSEQEWYGKIESGNQQGIISRADADAIIRKLSFKSFESKYKIMIIWLPERMRPEAANSLLKILEEPWDNTVFLMVSANPGLLLPTIISRTQEITVPAVDEDLLAGWLASAQVTDPQQAGKIARMSSGDLIQAKVYAGEAMSDTRGENFGLFTSLMRLSYNDRHMELLEWAETLAGMGRERQKSFLSYTIGMIRENYLLNRGLDNLVGIAGEEMEFSRKFSPFIKNENIERIVRESEDAIRDISQNGNPRIVFTHYGLTVSKMINKL